MRRFLFIGLAILGLLLVLVPAGLLLWARGSLPQTEGEVALDGLSGQVEILRDDHGIVTIKAGALADAHFALGYVHAQDRLAQMDLMRRTGAGRLSEVVGEATLGFDRYMRTLGLYRLAEAAVDRLEPETRAATEAYSAGVNAYIADESVTLPPEFLVLRYTPERWRPADSVVWGRLMALQLSFNWRTEVRRLLLAADLSPEQIEFLWPDYPADAPTTIAGLADRLDHDALTRLAEVVPWDWAPKGASNAWSLAGDQTPSGAPILANDPHLSLSAPGTWYLVRIETPELTLVGATAPGVPFLVLGHNGHIAWGFTTTYGDTQDIFIEQVSKEDPDRYETPGGPLPFEVREEVLAVAGGDPQTLTVRTTRHGPVLSDLEPEATAQLEDGQVLALAWTALREDDGTVDALSMINRARNWDDFLNATRRFHSPQQNIFFADTGGTIGFVAPARVPLRKSGEGSFPVPGWSGDYDWIGEIPFEELPQQVNPPSGRFVSGNNKIVPARYPHLITNDWPEPFRGKRIEEALAPGMTVAQHGALQSDSLSVAARELLPLLLSRLTAAPDNEDAGAALAGWNHVMDRDRPEPLIFYTWLRELNRAILADELGAHFGGFALPKPSLMARVLTEGMVWCDDTTTAMTESCEDVVSASFATAMSALEEALGDDWQDWRWGALHKAQYSHSFWGRIPVLRDWLKADLPADGGNYTVNRAGVPFTGDLADAYTVVHGAGYRAVYDLSDLDASLFVIAGGQSGNPLSANYGDLMELWRDGQFVKLVGPETAQVRRLVLLPR